MPHASTTDIDDIFSSKSTPSRIISSSVHSEGEKKGKDAAAKDVKKKKKNKKKKVSPHQAASSSTTDSLAEMSSHTARSSVNRKRPEPETVHDPSAALLSRPAKRMKTAKKDPSGESGKIGKDHKEDEEKFRDSRGTRPRKRTEEGYPIYTEEELGIQDGGGDTPLCPFDCDCCF